ncbi:MAG TPA: DUF2314 domain-containing protein [Vineibacter sp.]|nr:DUF2314 domain-containing protein [Vineibacter sp.]
MNKLIALVLAWATLLCGVTGLQAQTALESARKDDVVMVPSGNAAMAAAFKKAHETLDGFVRLMEAPPHGTRSYAVKVRISEGNVHEYFWIGNLARNGERFSGTLNNEPRLVKKVRAGQSIRFGRDEIVDWMYIDSDKRRMVGNYTACALLTLEKPEAAAAFKKQYGLVCD